MFADLENTNSSEPRLLIKSLRGALATKQSHKLPGKPQRLPRSLRSLAMTNRFFDSLESWAQIYCDKIIFWSLTALTFLLPLVFNPYCFGPFEVPKLFLLRVISVIVAGAWAIKSLAFRKLEWHRASLNLPWLAFLGTALVATILSVERHTSIYGAIYRYEGLFTLVNYAALYFFALNYINSERTGKIWLYSLLSSATIISLLSILQQFGLKIIASAEAFGSRSFSTFGNPLYLGAFLTLTIPLTISHLLTKMEPQEQARGTTTTPRGGEHPAPSRLGGIGAGLEEQNMPNSYLTSSQWFWFLTLLVALQIIALLLTLARAAWLGVAIGLASLLLLNRRKIILHHRQLILSLIVIALLGFMIYGTVSAFGTASQTTSTVGERALSTFQITEGTSGTRIYIWKINLRMIAARPFFGYGLDSYRIVFQRFKPGDWYRKVAENAIPDKPHNDFLQVAINQGIIGLVFYLVLLVILFKSLLSAIKRIQDHSQQHFLIGILSASLAYLVQLQFSFSVISVAPLFWLMIGIGMSNIIDEDNTNIKIFRVKWFDSIFLRTLGYIAILILSLWFFITIFHTFLADVYILRGNQELTTGYSKDAASDFKKALFLNKAEVRYYLFFKDAYFEQYKLTKNREYALELLKVLSKAEKLNRYQTEIYFSRGNLFRELAQKCDQKLLKKAINEYKRILEFDPNNPDAYFNMALVFFDLQNYDSAIFYWRKTINLNPRDEQAYIGLGEAFKLTGRVKQAKQAFQTALKINPYNPLSKKELQELSR